MSLQYGPVLTTLDLAQIGANDWEDMNESDAMVMNMKIECFKGNASWRYYRRLTR